jgi:hypothetical protein
LQVWGFIIAGRYNYPLLPSFGKWEVTPWKSLKEASHFQVELGLNVGLKVVAIVWALMPVVASAVAEQIDSLQVPSKSRHVQRCQLP